MTDSSNRNRRGEGMSEGRGGSSFPSPPGISDRRSHNGVSATLVNSPSSSLPSALSSPPGSSPRASQKPVAGQTTTGAFSLPGQAASRSTSSPSGRTSRPGTSPVDPVPTTGGAHSGVTAGGNVRGRDTGHGKDRPSISSLLNSAKDKAEGVGRFSGRSSLFNGFLQAGAELPAVDFSTRREFEFTDDDFERVRTLIYQRAGISLAQTKRDMVYTRLSRRLRAKGLKKFSEYLDQLQRQGGEEWEQFVNALTTNLTSFFRESHHFDILADLMRQSPRHGTPFRIWCCASSTGEEPYTLAMTAAETLGVGSVQIIASDIDTQVLKTAEQGIYGRDRIQSIGQERLTRFFNFSTATGDYTAKQELKQMITFRRINLLDTTWSIQGSFDAIFCRNVLIYFDRPTQQKILERFIPLLKPGGLYFSGYSESWINSMEQFVPRGKTVYSVK